MPPTTNYSKYLGNLEPLETMRQNVRRIQAIAGDWTPEQFDRSYAPGKWTARQILTHLAHTDRQLLPEELLQRARAVLAAQEVPVELQMLPVAWLRDPHETRHRLVAALSRHAYSDIKLLFAEAWLQWVAV